MRTFLLLILLFSTTSLSGSGGENHLFRLNQFGFDLGYGFQDGLGVNYFHRVCFTQLKGFVPIFQKKQWSMEVVPIFQFNFTRYKESNNSSIVSKGSEFGLNIAFAGRYHFKGIPGSVYLMAGAGPHYVSGVPERQTPGFIFSDNIIAGFEFRAIQNVYFNLSGGFRHISNASIKQPNGGINNLMVFAGLSYAI